MQFHSWLLDLLLGTNAGIFGRRQLMALVDLHRWVGAGGGGFKLPFCIC